jgi:hypothetical protein
MPYKKQKSYKKTKSKSKKGRLHQKRSTKKKIQHRKNRKIMLGGEGTLVSFVAFTRALEDNKATDALLEIYKYRTNLPATDLGTFRQLETVNGCMTSHNEEVDITELEQLLLDDKDFDALVKKLNLNDQEKQEWKAMFDKVKAVFDSFREPTNTTNDSTIYSSSLTNPIPIQEDPIVGVNPTINPVKTSDTNSTSNIKKQRRYDPLPVKPDPDMKKRNQLAQNEWNVKNHDKFNIQE